MAFNKVAYGRKLLALGSVQNVVPGDGDCLAYALLRPLGKPDLVKDRIALCKKVVAFTKSNPDLVLPTLVADQSLTLQEHMTSSLRDHKVIVRGKTIKDVSVDKYLELLQERGRDKKVTMYPEASLVGWQLATVLGCKIEVYLRSSKELVASFWPIKQSVLPNHHRPACMPDTIVRLCWNGLNHFDYYTDPTVASSESRGQASSHTAATDPQKQLCICKRPYDESQGDMIECTSAACTFGEWFHFTCVNMVQQADILAAKNNSSWRCPLCFFQTQQGQPPRV